jgi:hypothetical protein
MDVATRINIDALTTCFSTYNATMQGIKKARLETAQGSRGGGRGATFNLNARISLIPKKFNIRWQ